MTRGRLTLAGMKSWKGKVTHKSNKSPQKATYAEESRDIHLVSIVKSLGRLELIKLMRLYLKF